jgi:hypothetical protein
MREAVGIEEPKKCATADSDASGPWLTHTSVRNCGNDKSFWQAHICRRMNRLTGVTESNTS